MLRLFLIGRFLELDPSQTATGPGVGEVGGSGGPEIGLLGSAAILD
jgi:hypothetical protein